MTIRETGSMMKVEEQYEDSQCTTGDSSIGIKNAGNIEGLEHRPNRNIIR